MASKTENQAAFDAVLEALKGVGLDAEEGENCDIAVTIGGRKRGLNLSEE